MTSRYLRRVRKARGLPPGTLAYHGPERAHPVRINRVHYDLEAVDEREITSAEVTLDAVPETGVTWFDLDGVHEPGVVAEVAARFGLDPLGAEDILSLGQRPKANPTDTGLYMTLRALSFHPGTKTIKGEQVSLVQQKRSLLSFQEEPGDLFEPMRVRIRAGKGRVRGAGPDYLLYALVDLVVDGYFEVVAALAEHAEAMEDVSLDDARGGFTAEIQELRKEVVLCRRAMWPLREALERVIKSDDEWVEPDTIPFFEDVLDHLNQLIDTADVVREGLSALIDSYISLIGLRSNAVMQMLTLVATIFIPLTFLAGIYGMNFEYMPELAWRWAYPVLLGGMAATGIGMLVYFRRKGWL
jgi:magnesium transporter